MAFPVIRIGSGGSDTNQSGTLPDTPVNGTNASTNVGGTTVTVDASKDISSVPTDGSAAIYINDTVAGHRRWAKITGSSGSGGATPQFTVAEAFTGSLSAKTWGVGGKRALLSGALLLFENNSLAGDLMPGWTIEVPSGWAEGIGSTINWRRAGDLTSGPCVFRAAVGSPVKPSFNMSVDPGSFIRFMADYQQVDGIEFRCSAGTHTSSALRISSANGIVINNCKVTHASQNFTGAVFVDNGMAVAITNCEFSNCLSDAILFQTGGVNMGAVTLAGNYIHDNAGWGVNFVNNFYFFVDCFENIFAANALGGVNYDQARNDNLARAVFRHNDFYNQPSGKHGFVVQGSNLGLQGLTVSNNYFAKNGGWGIAFAALSAAGALAYALRFRNNGYWQNSTGECSVPEINIDKVSNADPQNANYGVGGDFNKGVGSPLVDTGYPSGGFIGGGGSATRTNLDTGCSQIKRDSFTTLPAPALAFNHFAPSGIMGLPHNDGSLPGGFDYLLNSAATWLALCIRLDVTKTLSSVRFFLKTLTGAVTTANFTCACQTDTSGAPSGTAASGGTAVGATTTLASSTWIQWDGFSTSLTAGTPFWVVLKNLQGTPASNYPTMRGVYPVSHMSMGSGWSSNPHYGSIVLQSTNSGSTWPNAGYAFAGYQLIFSDGTSFGMPFSDFSTPNEYVYRSGGVSREWGFKFTSPANAAIAIKGASLDCFNVGGAVAGPYAFRLYTGSSPTTCVLAAQTIGVPSKSLTAHQPIMDYFASPVVVQPGTVCRMVLADTSNTGATGNMYMYQFTADPLISASLLPFNGTWAKTSTGNGASGVGNLPGTPFTDVAVGTTPPCGCIFLANAGDAAFGAGSVPMGQARVLQSIGTY